MRSLLLVAHGSRRAESNAEIGRLAEQGPDARELRKARNQLLTDFYREMSSLSGRADALGRHELFQDDWRKLFGAEQRYETVTAADIQRVLKTWLIEDHRSVATLVPHSSADSSEETDR